MNFLRIFGRGRFAVKARSGLFAFEEGNRRLQVVEPGIPSTAYRIGKRTMDLVLSVGTLLLFAPLFLIISVLIMIDSPGLPFFCQIRVGKRGKTFNFYKFRSMIRDAERYKVSLSELNEAEAPLFKMRKDPRVTAVGRILRKASLDELPQMINVLRGEMSLVGPRPHLPEEVAQYTEKQAERLLVTPGIVCFWQATQRCSNAFDEWIQSDLEYIRRRSFGMDLKIIFQTVKIVLSWKKAS